MYKFSRPRWTPTHSKVAAGFAIGLAGAGLMYGAAATSADFIAGSFVTAEIVRHGHAVEFNDRLMRASSKKRAASATTE